MKKKVLSFVLVLVLLVSTLPFGGLSQTANAATKYIPRVTVNSYAGIKNVGSGRYLNVYCNKSANNTNITLWDWDNTSGVKFMFQTCGDGLIFVPQCAKSKVVNVYGNSPKAGSNVCLWSKTSHSSQIWIPEYIESQKAFIFRLSYNRNLVLTADGTKNGSNVCVRAYNSSNKKQLWTSSLLNLKETTTADAASTLAITPGSYPTGKHEIGCMFDLTATVKSNYNITSVTGEIVNASTGKTVYSGTATPNAKSFKVACSKIDSALKFDKLSKGKYYIKYTAKDTKTTKTWKSGNFEVADTSVVTDMIWPLENGKGTVSSKTGWRQWDNGTWEYHVGTDISAAAGTKIISVADGKVIASGWNDDRGYFVTVKSGQYLVVYQHMLKTPSVSKGASVKKGQTLGYVGNTGLSYGNHLHIEVSIPKKSSDFCTGYVYNCVVNNRTIPVFYGVTRGSKNGSYYTLNIKQEKAGAYEH